MTAARAKRPENFKKVMEEKRNDDVTMSNDVSKLPISFKRICVHSKSRPDDDAFPTMKKDLLTRWDATKDRKDLSPMEYVTSYCNDDEDIALEVNNMRATNSENALTNNVTVDDDDRQEVGVDLSNPGINENENVGVDV